jgi:hypothetical protein
MFSTIRKKSMGGKLLGASDPSQADRAIDGAINAEQCSSTDILHICVRGLQ